MKTEAERLALPVYQPESLRTPDARQPLVDASADLFIVAAYGLIFGEKTLAIPRLGCLNLHASLLPVYRGASPISAAILNGDDETGVTLMVMERGLDTGPTLARVTVTIEPDDTTESLTEKLANAGAELAVAAVPAFASGQIAPVPQASGASLVRPLVKADGELDFTRSAAELERQIRAMWPWPRAWADLNGETIQVHRGSIVPPVGAPPGTVVVMGREPVAACGENALRLDLVQLSGGKPISGRQFATSRFFEPGARFTPMIGPSRPPLIVPLD